MTATSETMNRAEALQNAAALEEALAPWAGEGDEPVFSAPWQATAFALTVRLHEQGHFTWPQWSKLLGEEVARSEADGGLRSADDYYGAWLSALERMVIERGLGERALLGELAEAWREAERTTPHGEPILLKRRDD